MQPFFADVLDRLQELRREMIQPVEGLTQVALDWPPGKDMNSLVVLLMHAAGAERYWIGDVVGQRPSGRDRDAEFQAQGLDLAALQRRLAKWGRSSPAGL